MRTNLRPGIWRRLRSYCDGCGRWSSYSTHKDCPRARRRRGKPGTIWIDAVHMRMGCGKCKQVWKIKKKIMHCACGHQQTTTYSDGVVAIGAADQVIASDGQLLYVLQRRSRAVVVSRLTSHGMDYTEEEYRRRHRR